MSAYTRTTGKKALVQRKAYVSGVGTVTCVQALPISKVLAPLPCDACQIDIPRGEVVVRERIGQWWYTRCGRCVEILPVEKLL